MIVLDASAILEVLLRTPCGEDLTPRLLESDEALCAPHLIDVEIAQVLRRFALAGQISGERGGQALRDLADLPLERFSHEPLLDRAWMLRENMTAYDAMYVALAEALDAPLLTRDEKLAKTPGHKAAIELV